MSRESGRVVVVTGASAGVGRATAQAFAAAGDSLALLARGAPGLEDTRLEVEAAGGRGLVIPTDVADAAAVDRAAGITEQELGPIDVWINCAMATVFARFTDITAEEYARATQVTYLGYVHGTMSALRVMGTRDRGTIIQVGSALSYRAIPFQSAYCGAKFAVRGFTDSVRTELLHDGSSIRISMVQLPAINTPQFSWGRTRLPDQAQPVPPIFNPEVAAAAVVRAASSYRREWFVGGSSAVAIAASKLAPARLLDRYLAITGLRGQQVKGQPVPADRADNLFAPVVDKAATHGLFTDRATNRSAYTWLSARRRVVGPVSLAALAAGIGSARARRRRR